MSERATVDVEGIGRLPAIASTREFASVTGVCEREVQAMCKRGDIPASQARRGGRWRIPTYPALRAMGLV